MELLPVMPVVPPELLEPAVVPGSLAGAPAVPAAPGVAGEAPIVVPELLELLSVLDGAVADGVVVVEGVDAVDGVVVLLLELLLPAGGVSVVRLQAASDMPATIIRAAAVLRVRVLAFMGTPWDCSKQKRGPAQASLHAL